MRKVLLATTALVAMNVSVAQAADITISGALETEYRSTDATDTFYTDGNIVFKATATSDTGLTYSVTQSQHIQQAAAPQVTLLTIGGDFGSLYLGNADDDIAGMLDGALGQNNDIESELHYSASKVTNPWQTAIATGGNMITFKSNNMGGFTFGASSNVDADETSFAATYDMGGASVYFGSNEDKQNMGVKTSMAGFTIAVGSSREDGTTYKSSDVAIKYALSNGITVAALSSRGTNTSSVKKTYNNIGASYTIAPGLSAKVETGKADTTDYSYAAIVMSF
jgi:hypothetical protein